MPAISASNDAELPKDFRVDLLFPDEYSDFIAEVYYKDTFLLVISQEKGPDNPDIEFYLNPKSPVNISLNEFESALNYAKRRLFELRERVD